MNKKFEKSKSSSSVSLKAILGIFVFLIWLLSFALAGYFFGLHEASLCESASEKTEPSHPLEPEIVEIQEDCPPDVKVVSAAVPVPSVDKVTFDSLKRSWKCAQSDFTSEYVKDLATKDIKRKTKWQSVIAVNPKSFYDSYLTQYPGDFAASQPVTIFSHKPLSSFDQIEESCKVLDVVAVPDSPGMCVAVTETFHDVASYHILHAQRIPGTEDFAMKPNHVVGRVLPTDNDYARARLLFSAYFAQREYVFDMIKMVPRHQGLNPTVGCVVETIEELDLFKNSLRSAQAVKVRNTGKFCLFTTSKEVQAAAQDLSCSIIYLEKIHTFADWLLDSEKNRWFRRQFLQAWVAFSAASGGARMIWQAPGTVWFQRPDEVLRLLPYDDIDSYWVYTGQKDPRASPFYATFDFAGVNVADKPIHLMHEIIMHFDLAFAWESVDAVISYRLSENNARYGTSTYTLPPYRLLHTDMLDGNAAAIREAVHSSDRPMVVVPPAKLSYTATKQMLEQSGLWFP